ncbi:MAG: carboxypeptidase regulatory-like domain-containing protein [Longimicrobiales bacterium]|nr:carboxypeptidase regulatory-like domain-containing protein [Longimicrobiales bacterium]
MRTRLLLLALAVALTGGHRPLLAQDTSVLSGRVLRAGSDAPVADAILRVSGTNVSAVSGPEGRFVLRGLPAGNHTLEVRHPEVGDHALALAVSRAGERFEVVVRVSTQGMSVEVVEAAPAQTGASEAGGAPPAGSAPTLPTVTVREDASLAPPPAPASRAGSVVDRDKILQLAGSSRNLSDLIRRAVPNLYVRAFDGAVGDLLCLEFRGAQVRSMSPTNAAGTCNHPQVYLDGIPLIDPAAAYSMTSFEAIQWIQAISPAEAGPQFGGAPYGVILVTTVSGPRGVMPGASNPALLVRSRRSTFDWEQDPAGHPFLRAFAGAALGTAVGLAAGRDAWRRCVYVDDHTREQERTCPRGEVAGMGAAAVALPAVGSALGAHLGGRTRASEGSWGPAILGAGLALLPGYGFSLVTVGSGVDATNAVGRVFLVVGTPLFAALADGLYRHLR